MIRIVRYDPSMALRWDEFVRCSSNGTFLHLRGYMDYHADRFADCSLLAFDEKDRLVALLPANIADTTLWSHQGLTYGGWIVGRRHFATQTMLEVWDAAIEWMRADGITELIYKAIPHIYHRYPAEDDLYALFRLGASVGSCQIASAMPIGRDLLLNQGARQKIKNAEKTGITVGRSDDYAAFMEMLSFRLDERYGVAPVHTLDEMQMLAGRFPDNIKLYVARDAVGRMLAGTIVYLTDTVVHTQYIATTPEARHEGAFPSVVACLLENEGGGREWFDFGTSCEDSGRRLNAGLNAQKYGLGGRPLAYTVYRLKL